MPRMLLAVLVVVALGMGIASYRAVEARRLHAEIATVCSGIPALLAAVEFTLHTWPPETSSVPAATVQTLDYFTAMVQADQTWCTANSDQDVLDLVRQTMLWHYGNASLYLADYQTAARTGQSLPLPTSVPTAAPTAIPTAPPDARA